MKHLRLFASILVTILIVQATSAQEKLNDQFNTAFEKAYLQNPAIPKGILEAVAYTNTHLNHITHESDVSTSCVGMPNMYGVMGLMLDGKNHFRNSLPEVSRLSGFTISEIMQVPEKNILAFAKAYSLIKQQKGINSNNIADQLPVLIAISELPGGDLDNNFPMNSHLYSVLTFLNNSSYQQQFKFPDYNINLVSVFGAKNYETLSSSIVKLYKKAPENNQPAGDASKTTSTDYPPALYNAAASCNYSVGRSQAISAVAIHDMEGSYAGSISWFQTCPCASGLCPSNCPSGTRGCSGSTPIGASSAHYMIRSSDGQVTQMVPEADRAFHIGSENSYTIGIEHEGYCSQQGWYTTNLYNASAALVRDICNSGYGINPLRTYFGAACTCSQSSSTCQKGACIKIKGHQMYPSQTHTDPGINWDWERYYKLINNNPTVTTLPAGAGTFYDTGGPEGSYTNDERTVSVVSASCGGQVRMIFSSFNVELNWDYLFIYDGTTVNAPLIGKYTGTTSPGVVTSTSGSLCLEFRTDCATTAVGWAANYSTVNVPASTDYTWTGAVDSYWSNPLNWSCKAVPDESHAVIIPENTPNNCTVTEDAFCKSLTVSPNAIFTVQQGKTVNVKQ